MGLGGWGFGVGVLAPGRWLRESCFRRDRDPFPVVGLGFGVFFRVSGFGQKERERARERLRQEEREGERKRKRKTQRKKKRKKKEEEKQKQKRKQKEKGEQIKEHIFFQFFFYARLACRRRGDIYPKFLLPLLLVTIKI